MSSLQRINVIREIKTELYNTFFLKPRLQRNSFLNFAKFTLYPCDKSFRYFILSARLCLFFLRSIFSLRNFFLDANDGEFGIANVVNCPMEVSVRTYGAGVATDC